MKQKRLSRKEIQSIKEPEAIESFESDIDGFMVVNNLPLNLDLSGIYFVSAYINYLNGVSEYKKLINEFVKYNKAYERRAKKYSLKSDDFISYMTHKIRNIEIFYEPVVRHFSTAKILLVCCAETFVNEVAGVCMNGRKLDEFDKLSIIGKWLFIQDILKLEKKFNLDSQPMQGFGLLIKERNKLVHFKGMKESLKTLEIPNFINDLKLTPKGCKSNFNAVRDMITTLNLKWRGSYGPGWLKVNESGFRNPCFYLGNRELAMVLYSDEYDKAIHS
jgi:hypothetical protein